MLWDERRLGASTRPSLTANLRVRRVAAQLAEKTRTMTPAALPGT